MFRKSVTPILQDELTDCGFCCISMICKYYGKSIEPVDIKSTVQFSGGGLNGLQLFELCESMGLLTRAIKVESDFQYIQTPAILHWEGLHYVILEKIVNNRYYIVDPAIGKISLSESEFSKSFTGIAFELTPSSTFIKNKVSDNELIKPRNIISLFRSEICKIVTLSLIIEIFSIIYPFYMQIITDDVIGGKNYYEIPILSLSFLLVLILEDSIAYLLNITSISMMNDFGYRFKTAFSKHLINIKFSYFENRSLGDVLSRYNSLEKTLNFFSIKLSQSFSDVLFSIITLAFMLYYSFSITIIILIFICGLVFLKLYFYPKMEDLVNLNIVSNYKSEGIQIETIKSIFLIKVFSFERKQLEKITEKYINQFNSQYEIKKFIQKIDFFNKLLLNTMNIIVISGLAYYVVKNNLSLGAMLAYLMYKDNFLSKASLIIDTIIDYKVIKNHLSRVNHVLINEIQPQKKEVNEINPTFLEIKKLTCTIGEKALLKNISLKICKGEWAVITGKSGSGKSTLIKCIANIIDSYDGDIFLDQYNIKKLSSLKSSIGFVNQDNELLSGTIAQNISMFEQDIVTERIIEVAKIAAIHDSIMDMSMQYNTVIGDIGIPLSGGQKQRIAIARALYHNPDILILDEASSALDHQTEVLINKNIKKLNIAVLSIAHRKESIVIADKKYKLNEGYLNLDN